MSAEATAATERWFRRRGVPHFIQNYNAREDILTRAIPYLVLALLLEQEREAAEATALSGSGA